jgi:membrane-bound lytic murein transglycosylase B
MLNAVLIGAALLLSAVLGTHAPPPAQTPVPTPVQTPAAPTQTFEEFLAGVRTEALKLGIRQATLDLALEGLEPNPVVVARDRAQPELTQSLDDYVTQRLTPTRIQTAKTMAETHAALLARIEETYGLGAPMMVSVWGLESNFGAFTGTYQTINSLATLAYDGRRTIFRDELFAALKIIDAGKATAVDLKGSWAGAMGQPQFMPSSYLTNAVDFDEDGRADIWTSLPDVFGSMANYLKNAGWRKGERWGREVLISKEVIAKIDRAVTMRTKGCRSIREMTVAQPLDEWAKLGVKLINGRDLPKGTDAASLVRGQARYFLVYRNYEAILAYNCSNAYAVSVGMLADTIGTTQSRPR